MRKKIKRCLDIITQRKVLIDSVRISDLKFYIEEGHGGMHISSFPPYLFFKMYLSGDVYRAISNFVVWYDCQFQKYFNIPKSEGGMKKGSLHKLIIQRHKDNGINLNEDDIINLSSDIYMQAIKERVQQRFDLLESIKNNGYKKINKDVIFAIKKGDNIYLQGGHHRCAIRHLLGYKYIYIKVIKEKYEK
jgi:hypothetical protein